MPILGCVVFIQVEDAIFGSGQVWTLDVVLSSGKGKLTEQESRCLVYKRIPDTNYMLKLKASKEALKEITKRFHTFPFTIRYVAVLTIGSLH